MGVAAAGEEAWRRTCLLGTSGYTHSRSRLGIGGEVGVGVEGEAWQRTNPLGTSDYIHSRSRRGTEDEVEGEGEGELA